jgi:sugar lactone lactonase YvrE
MNCEGVLGPGIFLYYCQRTILPMPHNRFLKYSPLVLIIVFYACHKDGSPSPVQGPGPNTDTPVVKHPDTLDKKQIVGWWDALKWFYSDNTGRQRKMYFGVDSFLYVDDPAGAHLGASTGKWWWKDKDSLRLELTAGWSVSNATLKITQLTKDSLKYLLGTLPGEYLRKDSAPITSKPISTIAGDGTSGFTGDNGPALAARFASPNSVTVDAVGNIYTTEELGHRVRMISASDGKITAVAGNGSSGYNGDGGLATAASMYSPNSVAIDRAGNIYISDYRNQCIRKVSPADGTISTFAGKNANAYPHFSGDGGPAKDALMDSPGSLAIDPAGNLYISDGYNFRIRRVDAATGIITTVAGNGTYGYSGDNGPATQAAISSWSIALDPTGEHLYIGDLNSRIRKVSLATGIIITIAGTGTEGYNGEGKDALQTQLGVVTGIAVDKNGNVYFSQSGSTVSKNNRVRKLSANDNTITTIAGSAGDLLNGFTGYSGDGIHATAFLLYYPCGICLDNKGNLLIADKNNNRIRKLELE